MRLRAPAIAYLLLQQHAPRVLNVPLDLDQELHGLLAVKQTVVVRQSQVHHWPGLHLAVHNYSTFLDSVKTQDGGLGQIDDGRTHKGTEDTTVADCERAAGHVLQSQFAVAGLQNLQLASQLRPKNCTSPPIKCYLTFLPKSAMALSMPTISSVFAFRTTGVTRPFSVATATLTST